ncbi:MAG: cobalamin biosynthesis protein P47K [Oscillospiraceae bacterium]|jgi:G3E family GTPase|nr:cobalamin biosynthesis protein P47K [Oscillospiraceae bacterium]
MKVLILGGFLGSGKTTVLLQLASKLVKDAGETDGTTVMIIENEIGEVGVDDKILKAQGLMVKELFAGCACCTSGGDLLQDIGEIQKTVNPKWVIVEATGVAYPRAIKESVESNFKIPVGIVSVADASRWQRLWNAMSQLIIAQLDCADLVLVNKVDLVEDKFADDVASLIHTFNPNAEVHKITAKESLGDEIWSKVL